MEYVFIVIGVLVVAMVISIYLIKAKPSKFTSFIALFTGILTKSFIWKSWLDNILQYKPFVNVLSSGDALY